MDDPHSLARFVAAQESFFDEALAEIRGGRKQSHWMWFIFPQLRGLGRSEMATYYGISGRSEAVAYLGHPLLGPRLRSCTEAVVAVQGRSAREIFGSPDHLKLQSCATLFAKVAPPESIFEAVLQKYYAGQPDERTLKLLGESGKA